MRSSSFGSFVGVFAFFVGGAVVGVSVVGCTNDAAKDTSDAAANDSDAIVKAALAAQNARVGAVRDYAVVGEVKDVASGQTMSFSYAMQQPAYSVGDLKDPVGNLLRSFVFDGKVLAIVDGGTKTVTRRDLSQDEEQMLLTLHEIFSQFVCEGWRPPLIKPQGTKGSRAGDDVVLVVPVDDPAVASQRLTLSSSGAFKRKELLDKGGNVVVSTVVVEDATDEGTGLTFPRVWRHTEGGSTQQVTLSSWKVNAGVDPARFNTNAVPDGFTADRTSP